MELKGRGALSFLLLIITFVLFAYTAPVLAHCAKDSTGNIYCSQYPTGGVEKDNIGHIRCGKGECRKDNTGNIMCSKVIGGGAETDELGNVLCLGGCEPASQSTCVKAEK